MNKLLLSLAREFLQSNEYRQGYGCTPKELVKAWHIHQRCAKDEHEDGWNPTLSEKIDEEFGRQTIGVQEGSLLWMVVADNFNGWLIDQAKE